MDLIDKDNSVKNHQEIISMLDEIRHFEKIDVDIETDKKKKEDKIYEVDLNKFNEEKNIDKPKKILDIKRPNIFNRSNEENTSRHPLDPAIFNIGFNDNGNLVNLDLKIKEEKEGKQKKINLKNVLNIFSRKNKSKEKSDSKMSKIKSKFGGISKIKKIIPSKSKKEEKPEEGSEK